MLAFLKKKLIFYESDSWIYIFQACYIWIFKWHSLFFIPFFSTYFKCSAVYESQKEKQSIDQIMQEKFS